MDYCLSNCLAVLHQNVNCCFYLDADAIRWWSVSSWSSQILYLLAVLWEDALALIGLSASLSLDSCPLEQMHSLTLERSLFSVRLPCSVSEPLARRGSVASHAFRQAQWLAVALCEAIFGGLRLRGFPCPLSSPVVCRGSLRGHGFLVGGQGSATFADSPWLSARPLLAAQGSTPFIGSPWLSTRPLLAPKALRPLSARRGSL